MSAAANIQASWIDDSRVKLPVATKCKTAKLRDADLTGAALVTSGRLPFAPDPVLPEGESTAKWVSAIAAIKRHQIQTVKLHRFDPRSLLLR